MQELVQQDVYAGTGTKALDAGILGLFPRIFYYLSKSPNYCSTESDDIYVNLFQAVFIKDRHLFSANIYFL